MNWGVGCLGSPIDRLIGDFAAFGVTPANKWRSRSNGYGCNSASCGFNGLKLEGGRDRIVASESGLYVTAAPSPARPWRAGALIALLLALACLALTLAHWGWIWFGPSPVFLPVPAPETDLARTAAGAHLFGDAALRSGAAAPSADLGEVRLQGVFAERDGKGYALLRAGTRGAVLVAAGQEFARGLRLESVRPDGITVIDGGVRHELALRVQAAAERPRVVSATPTSAACAIPGGFKGPVVRLNAELLGGMIGAPDTWKALVAPAAGALAVRDQSGFAGMLGLKNGDRVERANGIALAVPDDISATILVPLTRSQPVWLAGTRDGRPQQWLYLNAGSCPG
jgi:general secretion pathway protein C